MGDARTTWARTSPPWKLCIEEAWTSWRGGSAGVGAVIVDGSGQVVAVGRNRMLDPPDAGPLAGTPLAHAEMNALAQLRLGSFDDHELYTSFEPCLMCWLITESRASFALLSLPSGRADPSADARRHHAAHGTR